MVLKRKKFVVMKSPYGLFRTVLLLS